MRVPRKWMTLKQGPDDQTGRSASARDVPNMVRLTGRETWARVGGCGVHVEGQLVMVPGVGVGTDLGVSSKYSTW